MLPPFTAADLVGVCIGFVLFSVFAFAPGYVFSWAVNAFGFRRRTVAARIVTAVPVSIALTPVVGYYAWHCWFPLVWITFGVCAATCGWLLLRDGVRPTLSRPGRILAAIAAAWVVLGTLSLVDVQIGNRLYFPVVSADYSLRTAITAAISRTGVPPSNPLFFANEAFPLRYHYFWLIPCSLVDQLGGTLVSARQAMIAGTLWCGLGLFSVIALYMRFFQRKAGLRIERRTLIGVALLAVTGLDLIPVLLFRHVIWGGLPPSIEWWNNPIMGWIHGLLWVPHHLASLIACLTGFLLTWDSARQENRPLSVPLLIGAGLAFVSACGMSIYVAFVFAAGQAFWLIIALAKKWWCDVSALAVAGSAAVLLALPFLFELSRSAESSAFVVPTVRSMGLAAAFVPQWVRDSAWALMILNAAVLPLNYFFEYGFFLVVACLYVGRRRRPSLSDKAELYSLTIGSTALILTTFLRSVVITNNDLGWRGPLVLQFVLLLWAAELWDDGVLPAIHGARSWLIVFTLVVGLAGTACEVCLQRAYPMLSDVMTLRRHEWLSPDQQLGRRTFDQRRAYEELQRVLPENAVVQNNPGVSGGYVPAELYSGRQQAAAGDDCGAVFGGPRRRCEDILPRLKRLYSSQPGADTGELARTCRDLSISALLVKDTDRVWQDRSSWAWREPPLFATEFVRVIRCGSGELMRASGAPK